MNYSPSLLAIVNVAGVSMFASKTGQCWDLGEL